MEQFCVVYLFVWLTHMVHITGLFKELKDTKCLDSVFRNWNRTSTHDVLLWVSSRCGDKKT